MDNDTYVLVSDDEEVVGLFQNSAELGDVFLVLASDGKSDPHWAPHSAQSRAI